uniref:Uncharacterized protein n=1 Tax=Arundo donax TaxID=35708 RepID=A0A0A8YEQ3_ARUDO
MSSSMAATEPGADPDDVEISAVLVFHLRHVLGRQIVVGVFRVGGEQDAVVGEAEATTTAPPPHHISSMSPLHRLMATATGVKPAPPLLGTPWARIEPPLPLHGSLSSRIDPHPPLLWSPSSRFESLTSCIEPQHHGSRGGPPPQPLLRIR